MHNISHKIIKLIQEEINKSLKITEESVDEYSTVDQLDKFDITEIEFINDILHINQNVNLSGKELREVPEVFAGSVIHGTFNVGYNYLTSWKNFPAEITGDLKATNNKIKGTLVGYPIVKGFTYVDDTVVGRDSRTGKRIGSDSYSTTYDSPSNNYDSTSSMISMSGW